MRKLSFTSSVDASGSIRIGENVQLSNQSQPIPPQRQETIARSQTLVKPRDDREGIAQGKGVATSNLNEPLLQLHFNGLRSSQSLTSDISASQSEIGETEKTPEVDIGRRSDDKQLGTGT